MKPTNIAVIASTSEYKAFCTFIKDNSTGLRFINIQYKHELQGLQLA